MEGISTESSPNHDTGHIVNLFEMNIVVNYYQQICTPPSWWPIALIHLPVIQCKHLVDSETVKVDANTELTNSLLHVVELTASGGKLGLGGDKLDLGRSEFLFESGNLLSGILNLSNEQPKRRPLGQKRRRGSCLGSGC